MRRSQVLFITVLLGAAAPSSAGTGHSPSTVAAAPTKAARKAEKVPVKRDLRRRPLRITDDSSDSISEIHVAAGTPTTLSFQVAIKEGEIVLADVKGNFYPPQLTDKAVILVPKEDLPEGEVTSLSVALTDGTLLPFKLVTAPGDVDLQVDVEVALDKKAAPDSAQALKAANTQLRAQLVRPDHILDGPRGSAAGSRTWRHRGQTPSRRRSTS